MTNRQIFWFYFDSKEKNPIGQLALYNEPQLNDLIVTSSHNLQFCTIYDQIVGKVLKVVGRVHTSGSLELYCEILK